MPEMQTVRVPQLAWYGDTELELHFPKEWEVLVSGVPGDDMSVLNEAGIREAFAHPFGSSTIRELARDKREVVIVFDDMSRGTPTADLVPYILEELEAAGIPDESIRFIAGIGAHRTMTRIDFAKKLGEEVLYRFPVYNHNPFENCTFLGNTQRGTPVWINSEVMSCDLRIGIGGIVPHPITGFGGGCKIVLPGIAGIETIEANHGPLRRSLTPEQAQQVGLGLYDENTIRMDVEEAARMAGLAFKIDAVMNSWRQMIGVFVGDPVAEHREGVKLAKKVYATHRVPDATVVVVNSYAKGNEATLSPRVGAQAMGANGGDLVVIANTPEGQVLHYLLRSFGKTIGGRLWQPHTSLPRRVKRLIVYSPFGDKVGGDWIGPRDSIIWARTWDAVLEELKKTQNNSAKVHVLADATIQYFPESG